jgi:hypothetical protein
MPYTRSIGALLLATILSGCVMVHERRIVETPVATPPVMAIPVAPPPSSTPAIFPAGLPPQQVPNPNYVVIPMEITINKPVKDVWARIGKYCDITEWMQLPAPCSIVSGKDNEVGAVRTIGAEILVAKTEYSYAYTQPVREGRIYNLYHGNLEARPVNANTTKILYTLIYDLSQVAGDDAAKAADVERRRTQFLRGMNNMKILCEGGTLPPPPAPAAPAAPPARN